MISALRSVRNDIADTFRFFSRIPMPKHWGDVSRAPSFQRSAWALIVLGFVLGMISGCIGVVGSTIGFPAEIAALLMIITSLVLTGCLHEDGLADTADGLFGGASKDRRIEIMRDSRIGVYGMLALVLALAIKWTILADRVEIYSIPELLTLMVALETLSRAALMCLWSFSVNASQTGLSASVNKPGRPMAILMCVLSAGFLIVTPLSWLSIALFYAVLIGLLFVYKATCSRLIGGQTGDTMGAFTILVQLTLLLVVSAS